MNGTPVWITEDLLQDILGEHFGSKSLVVTKLTCRAAIPTGENYCSDVLRIHVSYKGGKNGVQETKSFIIKHIPNDGLQNLSDSLNLFDTEIETFSRTIPQMNEIIGKPGLFSANCFRTFQQPTQALMLEDLSPRGYIVANRHAGLDLDHCMTTLKKLALFHSASAVLYSKNKVHVDEIYASGIYAETDIMKTIITNGFNSFTNALERWPDLKEYYHPKFAGLGDSVLERTFASWRRKPGGFCVLNHGDWWSNNMMFAYDSNRNVVDCQFIDFQLSVYTSPAIDLHYFLTSSPAPEIASKHKDFLLDYYYANLLLNLIELKFDLDLIPTKEEFMADYRERAFYALTTLACIVPLIKAPNRDDANFECLVLDESVNAFRHDIYRNDVYKNWVEITLRYFDGLGTFDDFDSRL